MLLVVQPNFEFAAKDVEKLLALVSVRLAAVSARLDAKEVRLHGGVAPGEELHTDAGRGFKDFAMLRADEALRVAIGFEERHDIGFVKTRDAAKGGNGRTHLAAFERAEETDRNTRGLGYLRKREAAASAQAAKPLTGYLRRIGGSGDDTLFLEHVDDSGRI